MFVRGETNDEACEHPAVLSHEQWRVLVEAFAEMCLLSGGAHEDLHDRAVGVLEALRPPQGSDHP
jgi:hypothetical protein